MYIPYMDGKGVSIGQLDLQRIFPMDNSIMLDVPGPCVAPMGRKDCVGRNALHAAAEVGEGPGESLRRFWDSKLPP